MKRKKRLIVTWSVIASLIVLVVVVVVALPSLVDLLFKEDEFELNESGTGYILRWTYEQKSIVIPDTYKGLPVTEIAINAYRGGTKIKSVKIPNSVTVIGIRAFEGCTSLTSIEIPDSVTTIEEDAFKGCTSLTSISIPDSVTSIGGGAFSNTAYGNNESNWTDDVLYLGNHLIGARRDTISRNYKIKDGTRTIADYAFAYCEGLASITIPHGVTTIGDRAFRGCSALRNINIPDSVTMIGDEAFYDTPYYTAYYNDESNWTGDVLYIGKHLIEARDTISEDYQIKNGRKTIAGGAFENCSSLTNVMFANESGWKVYAN